GAGSFGCHLPVRSLVRVQPAAVLRAVHDCIAYGQRSWNQPKASPGVTWSKTLPMAVITASIDRAPMVRKPALILENISSIGVRSGLYTGNGSTRAPTASMAATAAALLCADRLSHTTTSPAPSSGTKTRLTKVSN